MARPNIFESEVFIIADSSNRQARQKSAFSAISHTAFACFALESCHTEAKLIPVNQWWSFHCSIHVCVCVPVCVCVCQSKKSENTTLPLCKVQHQSKFLWHDVKFSSVKIKFCTEAITIRITKRLRVRERKRGAKRRARTHTHTRNPKAGDPITPRKKILKKTNRNRNKQATK